MHAYEEQKCNRTACETTNSPHRLRVRWWNRVTQAYYCTRCARRINDSAAPGTEPLCELHYPCDSCEKLFAKDQLNSFNFVPNDKRHLGMSESESIDLCSDCEHH